MKNRAFDTGRLTTVLLFWLVLGWSRPAISADDAASDNPDEGHLQLAPINVRSSVGGNLGYTFTRTASDNLQSTQQIFGVGVMVNYGIQTFIMQPWLAQVSSNLNVGVSNTKAYSSNAANTTQTLKGITGDIVLEIVKRSRFPFTARIFRENDTYSGSFSGSNGSSRNGYTLKHEYQNRNGRIHGQAGFTHGVIKMTGAAPTIADQFAYDWAVQLSQYQNFSVTGDILKESRPSIAQSALRNTAVVRHLYQPNYIFSLGSFLNTFKTGTTLPTQQVDTKSLQFNSFASWRPERSPLTMTSSVRLIKAGSKSNGVTATPYKATNFNLGANYMFSPFIRMYGSVNVSDDSGVQATTTSLALSASKGSGGRTSVDVEGYRYSTFISGSLATNQNAVSNPNQTTVISSSQHVGVSLGHALDKRTVMAESVLTTNLNQTISSTASTVGSLNSRLQTGGSMGLEKGATTFRMSANDSRALGGAGDFFQIVNLQAARGQVLARNQTISGNLTGQVTRTGGANMPTSRTPFAPIADVHFQNQRTFGVLHLTFDSILRVATAGSALSQITSSQAQNEISSSWENNFDYYIGRTRVQFRSNMIQSSGNLTTSILFNISRQF